MTEVKAPTTMDLLLAQINDYKRQQADATANRDNIIAQCEGGIKTCLWMIKVLEEAKAKDDAAKAVAEKAEADAAEIAKAHLEAGAAAVTLDGQDHIETGETLESPRSGGGGGSAYVGTISCQGEPGKPATPDGKGGWKGGEGGKGGVVGTKPLCVRKAKWPWQN